MTRAVDLLRERPQLAPYVLALAGGLPVSVVGPEQAAALLRPWLAGRETEALAVAALDRRHRPIEVAVLTTGSDAATVVDPRQVLRWALTRERHAHGILLAHNHPSGDPEPSQEDRAVTRRMFGACAAVGLVLVDHLVLADPDAYVSLADRGEVARA